MSDHLITIYLIAVNIAAFIAMGIDKERARRHAWRIPEKVLFLLALIGGSIGGILGMNIFHHKTKHLSFKIGFSAIFILQLVLVLFLLKKGIFVW